MMDQKPEGQRPSLRHLVQLLLHARIATLNDVWSLSLAEARLAIRLAKPHANLQAPSTQELHALMQAHPDTPSKENAR